MGAYTFEEMKEYIKLRMGQRPDMENINSDNYFGIWVNASYRQIATKKQFYFPQMETSGTDTTTDGTAYVDVPSDALNIIHVLDTTNSRNLVKIARREYLEYTDRADTDAEGEPTEWTRIGGYLYLHKTPDTTGETITMWYRKIPAKLTGTGTSALDDAWDEPIIELATFKGLMWLGEFEKAKIVKSEFNSMVSDIVNVYYEEDKSREEYAHADEGYL